MYNNKFIAAVKHKGKTLREFKDGIVRLPFGSDYSLILKNKNNTKALVNIRIDGKDVLDGHSLIVLPDNTNELKGFMKGDVVTNKFRFIEKTNEISNYRGDFLEDGLIEITYRFERKSMYFPWNRPWRWDDIWYDYRKWYDYTRQDYYRPFTPDSSANINYSNNASYSGDTCKFRRCNVNNDGITVPGKEDHQDFDKGHINNLEDEEHSIILNIRGMVKEREVKEPITVKTKITCPTCGYHWNGRFNYCGNCSTSLHY